MNIKLFELEGREIRMSVHCQTIPFLKKIIEEYPIHYMKVYSYLYYLCNSSGDNPFVNVFEEEKEEKVLEFLEITDEFSPEDDVILTAKEKLDKLYDTPTRAVWRAGKRGLEKFSKLINDTTFTTGARDGNIAQFQSLMLKLRQINHEFTGLEKDLQEEQSTVRGNIDVAYDEDTDDDD